MKCYIYEAGAGAIRCLPQPAFLVTNIDKERWFLVFAIYGFGHKAQGIWCELAAHTIHRNRKVFQTTRTLKKPGFVSKYASKAGAEREVRAPSPRRTPQRIDGPIFIRLTDRRACLGWEGVRE